MSALAATDLPLLDVLGADLQVPLLDGGSVRYANLDYAATAPALETVAARVAHVLAYAGSVHRGAGLPSQAASALYESCRLAVADAAGAETAIFTRNTTDAANLLAHCLPAHGDVVALDVEHHANLLPWQRSRNGLRCVAHAPTIAETLARLEAALAARPTALLAVTGASNVTGELLPIDRLAALAHAHGARLYVDAAQLAPHRPIDVGADYLAFSGHKLYAPYGAGALAGRADWLEAAEPYLAGGGAVRNVAIEHTDWASGPCRHEAGTPNLAGAAAIEAALAALDHAALEAHERALRDHVLDALDDLPGVRALRIWEDAEDAVGVVAITVDGYAPGHVGAYLSAEHGIGVRDGRFCAHPLLDRFGLAGALRASFGAGSTLNDAARLVAAVEQLVTAGPAHAYSNAGGRWAPVHDTRAWAAL